MLKLSRFFLKIQAIGCLLFFNYFSMSCGGQNTGADMVNVYTHRHYEIDRKLYNRFTEETGIGVNVVKASADELIQRLEIEGENSPADLLITVDAGRLFRAKEKGLLQPVESDLLRQNVPAHLRDPEGFWYGLTIRARVIVHSRERVNPDELSDYESLTDEKWLSRILVRSSENIYNQSLLASLIAHHGTEAARQWAAGIVQNMARPPRGNDRDQIKAVAAGIGDIALVNTYYLGLLLNSGSPEEREAAEKVSLFFPNQNGRGTHINVSGAGVTVSSKNTENAIRLLEFLTGPEAQQAYAAANYEYPVNPEVENPESLQTWGSFKPDTLQLMQLGKHNKEAVIIFDEVGWK